MTQLLQLPVARLMEPKRHSREVDALVHHCLSTKGSLVLQATAESLELLVAPGDGRTARGPLLGGAWRSPCLRPTGEKAPTDSAALLLLPLLFAITSLTLPHHQIFTLGRDDRTLGDFFMRNVFHAAVRRASFAVVESETPAVGQAVRAGRDLARTFTWIAKAALRDAVFDRGNPGEVILAACHVRMPVFSTCLLEQGATTYRRCAEENAGAVSTAEQEHHFWLVREQVMELYA